MYQQGDIITPRPMYGQAFIDTLLRSGTCEIASETPQRKRRPETAALEPAEHAAMGKARKRVHA